MEWLRYIIMRKTKQNDTVVCRPEEESESALQVWFISSELSSLGCVASLMRSRLRPSTSWNSRLQQLVESSQCSFFLFQHQIHSALLNYSKGGDRTVPNISGESFNSFQNWINKICKTFKSFSVFLGIKKRMKSTFFPLFVVLHLLIVILI